MTDPVRRRRPVDPPAPSPEPQRILYLPRGLIRDTHDAFLPYWRASVETACFWFGIMTDSVGVATTLALPRLEQAAGYYRVDVVSLRVLATRLRAQGLVNLAQVHTHPFTWVGHSAYDDAYAYSTRTGSLSFVWPDYGRSSVYDLSDVGILERQAERWVRLNDLDVARRVKVIDTIADQRWSIMAGEKNDDE